MRACAADAEQELHNPQTACECQPLRACVLASTGTADEGTLPAVLPVWLGTM
jgi:hypothetical protein